MNELIKSNRDVIEKEWCVEKPIYKLQHKIYCAKTNRIVLSGGTGVGKSITLYKLQDIGTSSRDHVIYANIKRHVLVPDGYNREDYLKYYFDTLFSQYLKKHLRAYYFNEIQGSSLFKDGGIIDQRTHALHIFETAYKPEPIELEPPVLSKAIREAKKLTGIKSISVAVDDFDKGLDTPELQSSLVDTLDCFDTTIIGVNSKSITGPVHKIRLRMQGYKVLSLNYSKKPNIVERIIKRRIDNFDDLSVATAVNYHKLVRVYKGDITAILSAIENLQSREQIPSLFDVTNGIMIKSQVDSHRKTKSKLYLPTK